MRIAGPVYTVLYAVENNNRRYGVGRILTAVAAHRRFAPVRANTDRSPVRPTHNGEKAFAVVSQRGSSLWRYRYTTATTASQNLSPPLGRPAVSLPFRD